MNYIKNTMMLITYSFDVIHLSICLLEYNINL